MKLGNRSTLQQIARRTVDVEFPELDTAFRLREMNGAERDHFEVASVKEVDGKRQVQAMYLRARLVASCLVDETGARIYADDEVEMLANDVPAIVLGKLFEAAQKLNGLDGAAVEDAAKNSASGPPDASSSA